MGRLELESLGPRFFIRGTRITWTRDDNLKKGKSHDTNLLKGRKHYNYERTVQALGRIWVGRGQGAEPVGGIDNKIEKRKQPCPFKIKAILQ